MIAGRFTGARRPLLALVALGAATSLVALSGVELSACGSGDGEGGGDSSSGATTAIDGVTDGASTGTVPSSSVTGGNGALPTGPIFLIMLENKNWADIKESASAPYIQSLMSKGAHAEQYYNPQYQHPSLGNYIWLESGFNLGLSRDGIPSEARSDSTEHLVTQLEDAGHTWKSYQEDISGTECPITGTGRYAPRHNPMVYFDDVTNGNQADAPRCIAHVRPYSELATDLAANTVADYNFITPNLCNDMHDVCAPQHDSVKQGDDWLSVEVPKLLASQAYANGATVFIAFDEGLLTDGPIMFFALSKQAKVGHASQVHFTHSSTIKTMEEIFGLPLLRHAGDFDTNDLQDLFNPR